MNTLIILGEKLWELADELVKTHEVIAPKDELSYGVIASSRDIQFNQNKPRKSLKEFFFAPRCDLFRYSMEDGAIKMVEPSLGDAKPRIVLGAHPCDVAALPILDKVFMWDSVDPFYMQQRSNTTIIALACDEPCAACFCGSVDGSPAGTEGADLLLSSLSEKHYHVQVITKRGEALVNQYKDFFTPSSEVLDAEVAQSAAQHREQVTPVDATIGRSQGLQESLSFDSPVWQSVAQQCVDCGVCTFVCPTCHCFDIQDEGSPNEGARVRLWDSCAFRHFTKTVVHEPRATHNSRYRQRIMHKFGYYPKNFGKILCVGCGRCIQYCPVSIDIRQVLETVGTEVR
jgi:sulfhydrogenase subunit beta (sulfur reductase)